MEESWGRPGIITSLKVHYQTHSSLIAQTFIIRNPADRRRAQLTALTRRARRGKNAEVFLNILYLWPPLCKRRNTHLLRTQHLQQFPPSFHQKPLNFRQIYYCNHIVRTCSKCYDSNGTFQPQVPFFPEILCSRRKTSIKDCSVLTHFHNPVTSFKETRGNL